MSWRELRFVCDAAAAEGISDALLDAGALSVSVEDADAGTLDERPRFGEPGSSDGGAWVRNTVIALIQADSDAHAMVNTACAAAKVAVPGNLSLTDVAEQDWVRLTQSQFDPIHIAEKLWIVPTWHEVPDPEAIALRLDPGLAFGTGSHPTTHLCLTWLASQQLAGKQVLDYGCGSGILAIAASLMGAAEVWATDIDPQALEATRANARANHCRLEVAAADQMHTGEADVVIANILTNPLKVLAPALAGRVRRGGWLTLSGILDSQADEVIKTYAPLIKLTVWQRRDGWVCLAGTKP